MQATVTQPAGVWIEAELQNIFPAPLKTPEKPPDLLFPYLPGTSSAKVLGIFWSLQLFQITFH